MKAKNKLRRAAKQKTSYGWKNWRKWLSRRERDQRLMALREQIQAEGENGG